MSLKWLPKLVRQHGYKTRFEDGEHVALVFGDIKQLDSVPVRIHRGKLVEDVFGPQGGQDTNLLEASMNRIESLGGGVLIYLRTGYVGVPHQLLVEQTKEEERKEWLEIGVGAQILRDLGLSKIRLIRESQISGS